MPLLVLLALAVLLAGCASAARPGEVTITGGTAQSQYVNHQGWGIRIDPAPPAAPSSTPWVIILDPLPSDPKAATEVLTAPPKDRAP